MYHGPKSAISVKTFHLPFSMESYLFLQFKMCHTVTDYLEHREKATIYNNILDMEAWTTVVHKEFIKIITTESLQLFCKILGEGIGLGLAKERPTK